MPGQHVDDIYEDALRKLYYKPLTDLEVQKATNLEIAQDERLKAKNDSVGNEVFRDVEASNLTPTEKQEVHQKLAQYGMNQELTATGVASNPATLLRSNDRYTNYTSAYLNQYAEGYVNSVRDLAFETATQVQIPKSVVGKVDRAFSTVENAYTGTNAEQLRDNVKKALKDQGVPDNVVSQVDQIFNSQVQGQGGLRPVDGSLKDDMDEFLRKNGVKTEGVRSVDQAFQNHQTKLDKVANLAGGQIPPQDMPANGELLGYLDKHGLSGGMTTAEREELKGVKVQDFQTLHKTQVDIAQRMVDATAKNLSQMSPEARAFLQSAFQPITDTSAMNVAGASTLVLRLASPKVAMDAQNLGTNPSTSDQGVLLERGAKTLQRYVNSIGVGSDKQDYATLGCNDLLKDQALKNQTLASYKAVGEGQDLDQFSRTAGGPLTVGQGALLQVGKLQQAANSGSLERAAKLAKLEPQFEQIKAAQVKLDKLNKPGINLEKFKAFFSKEGIQGAKTATQNKLGDLQKDLTEKIAQKEKETLDKKQEQLLKQAVQRKEKLQTEMPVLSHDEAKNLLDALDKLSPQKNEIPERLQLSSQEASNLLKGLEKLKGSVQQKRSDSLSLSEDEAGDLLKALNKVESPREKPELGSLKLSGDEADNLLKALNKTEKVSEEDKLDGFDLSENDFSDLLGALKKVSPESWEEVDKLVDTELSVEEIGDLIKELENLDLDEGPKQKTDVSLDGMEATPEHIEQMIKELENLDLGEDQKQTRSRSQSVGAVLEGSKHGTDSNKPKVSTNSLRSKHPELLPDEGKQVTTPGHKPTVN